MVGRDRSRASIDAAPVVAREGRTGRLGAVPPRLRLEASAAEHPGRTRAPGRLAISGPGRHLRLVRPAADDRPPRLRSAAARPRRLVSFETRWGSGQYCPGIA